MLSQDEFLWIWDLCLLTSFTAEVEIIYNQPNGGTASMFYDHRSSSLNCSCSHRLRYEKPNLNPTRQKSVRYKELE